MRTLGCQYALQPWFQLLFVEHLEPVSRIERAIPGDLRKRGQCQLAGSPMPRHGTGLVEQLPANTLPLRLQAYRKLVYVQRVTLQAQAHETQRGALIILGQPTALVVNEGFVRFFVQPLGTGQPGQLGQPQERLCGGLFDSDQLADV